MSTFVSVLTCGTYRMLRTQGAFPQKRLCSLQKGNIFSAKSGPLAVGDFEYSSYVLGTR